MDWCKVKRFSSFKVNKPHAVDSTIPIVLNVRRGWRGAFLLGVFVATLLFAEGCDTPYTRRVRQLDNAYQRGDLPREDYMRFVHEAERWETR